MHYSMSMCHMFLFPSVFCSASLSFLSSDFLFITLSGMPLASWPAYLISLPVMPLQIHFELPEMHLWPCRKCLFRFLCIGQFFPIFSHSISLTWVSCVLRFPFLPSWSCHSQSLPPPPPPPLPPAPLPPLHFYEKFLCHFIYSSL